MIDSHCHLDRLELSNYGGSLDASLAAAREAGIRRFLCISINLQNVPQLLEIQSRHADVDLSVGMHPLDEVDSFSIENLRQWAARPNFVAIGETGLDYFYGAETKLAQQRSFSEHLRVAKECAKPVVVHSRDAEEDTIEWIKQYGGERTGVFHCFTGDWKMACRALDLGYYISFSGIVTFRNADTLRDVAKRVPQDRFLIETDAPYLAPVPYRGKSNESKYLPAVLDCIADVRNQSKQAIMDASTENYFRLFHPSAPSMSAFLEFR